MSLGVHLDAPAAHIAANEKSSVSLKSDISVGQNAAFGSKATHAFSDSKTLSRFSAQASESPSGLYFEALSSGQLSKIPVQVLATQDFILDAINRCSDSLVPYLNELSDSEFSEFILKYDGLPEAMLGKLVALGLDQSRVPDDIKSSNAYLRVYSAAMDKQGT